MAGSLSIGVSPGIQEIFLTPGEVYEGSFFVLNPYPDAGVVDFEVGVAPFSVDGENYTSNFDEKTAYNVMTDWIEVENKQGSVEAGEKQEIKFKINVPDNAPGGGQYAALIVKMSDSGGENPVGVAIKNKNQIASLIYATVSGETHVSGEVLSNTVLPVYLGAPITVSSTLKNTGNVHTEAVYRLTVSTLFGDEEVYSNEFELHKNTVVPDTALYSETSWQDTPLLGLYRVSQEISFAGTTDVSTSVSLVCPVWFIVLVSMFIASIIFAFLDRLFWHKTPRKILKNPKIKP